MNGYKREELIVRLVDILYATPGTRELRQAYINRLQENETITAETWHRHNNGYIFRIEYSTSLVIVNSKEMVLGIDRDITESKKTDQALLKSEEKYRRLAENMSDVICTADLYTNRHQSGSRKDDRDRSQFIDRESHYGSIPEPEKHSCSGTLQEYS